MISFLLTYCGVCSFGAHCGVKGVVTIFLGRNFRGKKGEKTGGCFGIFGEMDSRGGAENPGAMRENVIGTQVLEAAINE
jgi:hypothetical protein